MKPYNVIGSTATNFYGTHDSEQNLLWSIPSFSLKEENKGPNKDTTIKFINLRKKIFVNSFLYRNKFIFNRESSWHRNKITIVIEVIS